MDNVDYLYVRVRAEEMLARLGESESIALDPGGYTAAPSQPVARASVVRRIGQFFRLRRRSIRVLPDPAPESGSST